MFESDYIKFIDYCLRNSSDNPGSCDKNSYDTISVIGKSFHAELYGDTLPLLTTRKIIWKSIVYELLWFISGARDISFLRENNVHIWDKNASDESWNARGLGVRPSPDYIGPSYGFQWRFGVFGDQLVNSTLMLINCQDSRRNLMCSWTPDSVNLTVLPPCHFSVQFIRKSDLLCAVVYMRSCDTILGMPFNIVSYSLLTIIMAKITGLCARQVTLMIGDLHIYKNHCETYIKCQQPNPILPPPTFNTDWIHERFDKSSTADEIKQFWDNLPSRASDIIGSLSDYNHANFIKYEMVNTSLTK